MSNARNAREINICRITQMMTDLAPTLNMMRMFRDEVVNCSGLNTPYDYTIRRVGNAHQVNGSVHLMHGNLPFSYAIPSDLEQHQFVNDMTLQLIQRERIMARAVKATKAA